MVLATGRYLGEGFDDERRDTLLLAMPISWKTSSWSFSGGGIRGTKTQRRWTRVDLERYASLPYGSTTPIPEPKVFSSWTGSVGEKLDKLLTDVNER